MIHNTINEFRANSLISLKEVLEEVQQLDSRKQDLVAPRGSIEVINAAPAGVAFGIGGNTYHPTKTGLVQIAELSGIPKNFLLETERKYPGLARDVIATWFGDNENVNRKRKHPVNACRMKHLFRCYKPQDDAYGVLRAVRSDRYRILDNSDIAAAVLKAVSPQKGDVEVKGSITDDRLFLTLTNWALTRPTKVGEEVAFRVRISNSETGYASLSVVPQVVVLSCLNGATVGRDLTQMHLGQRLTHERLLSRETLSLKNAAFFAEVKDVIGACFSPEHCHLIVDALNKAATQTLPDSVQAVENTCKVFSLGEETKKSIFAEFLSNQEPTRFGLAQAITQTAHQYEVGEYEKAAFLEDAGGQLLTNEKVYAKVIA